VANADSPIDTVSLALLMGATFVARSFSGDKGQLVPIIKAAIGHTGAAFIDVVSPCVAFNNHAGSTKSYDYVRAHNEAVNSLDFIEGKAAITADYEPGTTVDVVQHDGTVIRLHKAAASYDATDKVSAMNYIQEHQVRGEIVTGLLYVDNQAADIHHNLNTVNTPLNALTEQELCPGAGILAKINASLR
jgi:2-oxoglutarate ferredoxin oxidoreductase subunit beta